MASGEAGGSKWKHLRDAMCNLQDTLRCWTWHCAKKSGNKCSLCHVPSIASEIKADCIITAVVDCLQKLTCILNSEGDKSSRSTVYESDAHVRKKSSTTTNASVEEEIPTNYEKQNESVIEVIVSNNEIKPSGDEPDNKLYKSPAVIKTNDNVFAKPSRTSRRSQKFASEKDKNDTSISVAMDERDIIDSGRKEVATKTQTRPRGRPPKKRSSSESTQSEDLKCVVDKKSTVDNIVTPKKPKISNKMSNSISSTSKGNAVKSTPRKSITSEIEKKNPKGETPLHVACIKGNVERVRSLLEAKANPNTKDNAGWTPLHEVAIQGHVKVAELLLEANCRVDVLGPDNVTPLHEAVQYNCVPIVKMLVAYGAGIDDRNSRGKTPLDLATSDEVKEALQNTKKLKEPIGQVLETQETSPKQEMVLYGDSGLTDKEKEFISEIASNLNLTLAPKFGPTVTHLIVPSDDKGTCQPSMAVYCALLRGMNIFTREWIELMKDVHDISSCNWSPDLFEVVGIKNFDDAKAPERSRINAQQQRPGLFNGCHFFVTTNSHYKSSDVYLTRDNIMSLIKAGGGIVLKRQPDPEAIPPAEETIPYHASRDSVLSATSHIILYSVGKGEPEMKYNMKHCKTLPVEWFINSVSWWKLIDP